MTENKNAKTPTDDGHVAWACQCGRVYTVTCISSKPSKQEPVAWISHIPTIKVNGKQLHWTKAEAFRWSSNITPLYTTPPKQWVGLTAYEIQEIHSGNQHWGNFACAIEAKLKEKNGG